MDKTYVYQDVEVKVTGRVAEKPMPGGKMAQLVEVTPVNQDDGTWKKWVPPGGLFNIRETT